jgi:hypothetical protein
MELSPVTGKAITLLWSIETCILLLQLLLTLWGSKLIVAETGFIILVTFAQSSS